MRSVCCSDLWSWIPAIRRTSSSSGSHTAPREWRTRPSLNSGGDSRCPASRPSTRAPRTAPRRRPRPPKADPCGRIELVLFPFVSITASECGAPPANPRKPRSRARIPQETMNPNPPCRPLFRAGLFLALAASAMGADAPQQDWPNLARYRDQNALLAKPAPGEQRVVFMGDSITDAWPTVGAFFPGKGYICRGIGGQTTPQMLIRFRPDVIDLKPAVVLILAGTNDVAGNSGPAPPQLTEGNLASMAELARANGIKVVLSSILPAFDYPWRPGREPAPKIVALNTWIKAYAAANGFTYLDYFSSMADGRDGMRAEYSKDGVHPNAAGYAVMEPLAQKAITEALASK